MYVVACVNVYLKWIAIYLLLSTITRDYCTCGCIQTRITFIVHLFKSFKYNFMA